MNPDAKDGDIMLNKYYDEAYYAHYWMSWQPEKRAKSTIEQYSQELAADLATIPDDDKAQYQAKYEAYFLAWLGAKSKCVNWAVTGNAGLDPNKVERDFNRERARYEEWMQWRDRALKAIAKKQEPVKTQEEKDQDILTELKTKIDQKTSDEYGFDKSFVSNLVGRIWTLTKQGKVEAVTEIVNYALEKKVITSRHKVNSCPELAQKYRQQQKEINQDDGLTFAGGKIVINTEVERVQILFDDVPDLDLREKLKANGFRWSPRFKAWQRKSTPRGIYVARNLMAV